MVDSEVCRKLAGTAQNYHGIRVFFNDICVACLTVSLY